MWFFSFHGLHFLCCKKTFPTLSNKDIFLVLAGWLSQLEHGPYTKRSRFAAQSRHAPRLQVLSQLGTYRRQLIGVSFSHDISLSPPSSLYKSINISLGEDLKKKRYSPIFPCTSSKLFFMYKLLVHLGLMCVVGDGGLTLFFS